MMPDKRPKADRPGETGEPDVGANEDPAPILVTSNDHKLEEATAILGTKLRRADPEVPEVQSLDFAEVAAAKARAARAALGDPDAPVVVDDSGLVVGAWNGFPGALTKHLLGSVGVEGLLKMLSGFEDRAAKSVCVVAVSDENGSVHILRGEVEGTISDTPRGTGGFGYDPVFIPNGHERTYSEMGDEKHEYSHRKRAFERLGYWLEDRRRG